MKKDETNQDTGPAPEDENQEQPLVVTPTEPQPEGTTSDDLNESPAGAEENDGEPEKPEFGEYEDEASTDHTEENADFDAGNTDDAADETL